MLNPMVDFASIETDHAARHLKRAGGFSKQTNLLKDPETITTLRHIRSLQNTEQTGVWTLGLVPQAAEHLFVEQLDVPLDGIALLCSDGFSALVNDYGRYTAASLLQAACSHGLQSLIDELRQRETSVDPEAVKYPRFKQSDDATALLLSWSD